MFKKYSVGFWLIVLQSVILFSCVYEMFWYSASGFDCTSEELRDFRLWEETAKRKGLYTTAHAYGLCAPRATDEAQGTPAIYAKYSNVFNPDSDLPDSFLQPNVTDWFITNGYHFSKELFDVAEAFVEYMDDTKSIV